MTHPDFINEMQNTLLNEKIRMFVINARKKKQETVDQLKEKGVPIDYQYNFKFDEKKGALTYLKGRYMPMRIYPNHDSVMISGVFKKIIPYSFRILSRTGIFGKIGFVLSVKWLIKLYIEIVYFALQNYFLQTQYYSQPVREIYRVLTGLVDDKLKDIICYYVEYDMAYRYRLQDILACLDKEALKKKPIVELKRLLDILCKRESYPDKMEDYGMAKKWKRIFSFVFWVMVFNSKIKKLIVDILLNINLEEVAFSEEDICWTNYYEDYNFRGMNYQQREADNKLRFEKVAITN